MAHAKRIVADRTEKDMRPVELTLSVDEAETLLRLTGAIGGDPTETKRGLTDAIGKALRNVGIDSPCTRIEGSVYFKP